MNPERNTPQIHIYTYLYVEPKHREKINPDTVKDLLTRNIYIQIAKYMTRTRKEEP